jgi:hypothetical protein
MDYDKEKNDQIALKARKQLDTSAKFKQPRMTEILDNEDVYNFKLRPALQGRFNIPFDGVVMTGFIDTLVAQVNRPPRIEFEDATGANLKGARKHTAAWEKDQKKMRLKMKDRAMKHLAALSGRAIAKFYAESDPKYCPYFTIIDYLDFHCEPNGGGHLDSHYFNWQENIFRSKEDLMAGALSRWYAPGQVAALIRYQDAPESKQNVDTFNNKQSRYASMGLDMESHNYLGGALFNLVEGFTMHAGQKWHVIWEKTSGIWLRCVPLKQDFGIDETMFVSFASPQEDAFNFWNRGPADQIKPIAEAIRVNLNEVLNNNRKRNWDMKAVDQNMFPDLRKLDWRQDGIVHANVPLNQSIQNGIYRFETPEISGAINLNAYLNNLAGEKLGVSAQTQGDAKEEKVGIYKGNELQISKRMKLLSDSYEEMYEDLGNRYQWGLWDHASEDEMVKLISTDGVGWEKIKKEDKDPEYAVSVVSASVDLADIDEKNGRKAEVLLSIEKDPEQKALINLKAHVEEKFRLAGYDDEKIKKLMNTKNDATDELISEAKKAIEMILEGKEPGLNQGATTGYLQYINDWILDNADDLKPEDKQKLEAYFDAHEEIAMKNAEQKQFNDELAMKGSAVIDPNEVVEEVPGGAPVDPNIPPINPNIPVV